ncbi:DUF4333 domain-containing protein [Pseudonocardia sp. HH130630-07]|uniref:DUF4333 domain-containing protein n=1 Tax=Pseudonocardia sp. HH130630-07 TaxID=1690815 RepID=UPI000814BCDE|nr:DUF4333 domain-containing protein [Pseudonocardia sp. HH130630-07]ANY09128.1 hypothetical protein AFB00_25950 [Pseudonocardia sp. HH130630-07]
MSNPQGPGRYPDDDADATERTGELPAWGTPPPGGWGAADSRDGLEHTGAWAPERDARDGWADRSGPDAGWDPAGPRDTGAATTGGWAAQETRRPDDTGAWRPEDTGGWRREDTGAWGPQDTGGWGAQGGDRTAPRDGGRRGDDDATRAAPLWGDDAPQDQGDTWAVPTGRRAARRRAREEQTDAVPAGAGDWGAPAPAATHGRGDGGGWGAVEEGDEPWAPRQAVRRPPSAGKKWGVIGGVVALLVALGLVAALVWPGWLLPSYFDQTALQTGVGQVLSEDYGLEVGAVQCPDDVVVSTGTTFSCQAVVDGEQVEVPGVVTSDDGDYQVNRV